MRILLAGDTHGDLAHCQYLIRTAKKERCDRIFVLGDFGYREHMKEGVDFCNRLDLYANINNVHVYFLDGNHDKTSLLVDSYHDQPDIEGFLLVRPYIHYAGRGHRWTWDGCSFISLGGAYSVDKDWRLEMEMRKVGGPGSLWFPEEEMSDEDMKLILDKDPSPVHIMLAHDKPRGTHPGWNRKDILECKPNQDRLQLAVKTLTPRYFFHGHLHWYYSQVMDYEDHNFLLNECAVTGLACNPEAKEYRDYDKTHSWQVLDTESVK